LIQGRDVATADVASSEKVVLVNQAIDTVLSRSTARLASSPITGNGAWHEWGLYHCRRTRRWPVTRVRFILGSTGESADGFSPCSQQPSRDLTMTVRRDGYKAPLRRP
jgi:hypothetical protein